MGCCMSWLARLKKIEIAPESDPAKPEKPPFVGFVGTPAGTFEKSGAESVGGSAAANEPVLDPDRWCWPHSDAMNSGEIDTFTARVHQFMRQGLAESEAEVLTDKLVRRDRGDGVAGKQRPTVAAKPEPPTPKFLTNPNTHGKPWLTEREATTSKAYHAHHFSCPICIAAGRGAAYGMRCGTGMALWINYQNT